MYANLKEAYHILLEKATFVRGIRMLDNHATNHIIDQLVALRKKAGLSQEEVTVKLQRLGFNYGRGRLSMIETKKRPPSASLLVALKLIYHCDYQDFFDEVEASYKELLK